jgi:hypothetical protein
VPAVHALLQSAGFAHVQTITPPPGALYRAARAVYHRVKGRNGLAQAFRQDRTVFHARKG